jgi:hypothetical protein
MEENSCANSAIRYSDFAPLGRFCGYLRGCRKMSETPEFQKVDGAQLAEIIAAIRSPDFTHARTRYFMGHGTTYLYGRDHVGIANNCGSGVICYARGPSPIVDILLEQFGRTSPLSPTEKR